MSATLPETAAARYSISSSASSSEKPSNPRQGFAQCARHSRPRAARLVAMPPAPLAAAAAAGHAALRRLHDALPAKITDVTDQWGEEVVVVSCVLFLLLNIFAFLANVKAHEVKKRRRQNRAAANHPALKV